MTTVHKTWHVGNFHVVIPGRRVETKSQHATATGCVTNEEARTGEKRILPVWAALLLLLLRVDLLRTSVVFMVHLWLDVTKKTAPFHQDAVGQDARAAFYKHAHAPARR